MAQTVHDTTNYRRPSDRLSKTESVRALQDWLAFWAALPTLAPDRLGDGRGVLVLPGFLADDRSTSALRSVVRAHGYQARGWGLGTNIGPTSRLWGGALRRLDEIHRATSRPVTLIGQSLGGIFAREIARQRPAQVRQVITLGSPFRLTDHHEPGTTTPGRIYHALKGWHIDVFDTSRPEEWRIPLSVPSTAVYSRTDGVVPWQTCVDIDRPQAENVEVEASHCGMGFHPDVLRVVIDRLADPERHSQTTHRPAAVAV